jgi:Transglycosylase SLT domain/SPOR domain
MRCPLAFCGWVLACGIATGAPAAAEPAAPATETVHEALCRLIETAARAHAVPADFLTNLIWRESSFRTGVVSRAGAQGVAQFMPGTAAERGLADPFDPEQAIPHAARLIADERARFGNLGLAAAAYNAGAGRVERWLAKETGLPAETRNFVVAVTGRSADDWAAVGKGEATGDAPHGSPPRSCGTIVAALRRPGAAVEPMAREAGEPAPDAPFAPWGVQLAGNFSKERALASFGRARQQYAGVIGEAHPMIIGTRLRSRGTRTFYRIRLPADSRQDADAMCRRIRSAGGACVVLRS